MVSNRRIAVLGAASNIGIRPYEGDREARHLDDAPAALRHLGLVSRLGAEDLGDVRPAAYRDFSRSPGTVRNEREVDRYSRDLADRIASAIDDDFFPLVLGGDCSIVLGSLLGARRPAQRIGLAYLDAHADFGTPQESQTGSAASMCLALAVGRGDSPLARLAGPSPLVRPEDVALIGRRDDGQGYYGHAALATSGILDVPEAFGKGVVHRTATSVLERVAGADLEGFWIHLDADVLDPEVMPAVDSPEPGGPGLDEVAEFVAELVQHPRALGMQVTIYDPALDDNRAAGARLVSLLETVLTKSSNGGRA